MKKIQISPSILSADFSQLGKEIKRLEDGGADMIHVDVMDGHFVPNLTIGPPVIKALKKNSSLPFDVHLMIVEPDRYIKTFARLGSDILTVHYEACPHLHRTIQNIKLEKMKVGVALNPHTNVNVLEETINDIDLVCLMSVNPGFGGQVFIENTYKKTKNLKKLIEKKRSSTKIQIDGGVTASNAKKLIKAGADILVAGSFIFNNKNPIQIIDKLN